ncbi:DUF1404 family protein [Noviherbaspirillum sp.]|uniref:DUF1404 family protein n=1 Tax=Noviherbaspirillum sp. TaxID=1926288 RepID=UPI002D5491AA|nr:DUF1404 family protein [Noviherbaspirillum sp.]HZW20357.1 DUF1404 family protein [Noviherbaspirillum sp.]
MTRRPALILPVLLLVAAALGRGWLEATMARHMLIELPLLFAIGWLAVRSPRSGETPLRWNANSLPALFAAMLITAFWMLPVALDLAVLDARVGVAKALSMLVAGALTGAVWRSAGLVMQAFFIFNWTWMALTAGLLYQDAPQQLCSVYLSDQQPAAGRGMVILSLAVLGTWVAHAVHVLGLQEEKLQQRSR